MLAPHGRIGGYVIHTTDGLSPSEELRAAELGPTDVGAPAPPEELTLRAGFEVTLVQDVTAAFRETCSTLLRARERYAEQLRSEEGVEAFEDERRRKADMLEGIAAGLLRRSLVVAVKRP